MACGTVDPRVMRRLVFVHGHREFTGPYHSMRARY